jgi:hypothetical protein
LAQEIYEGNNSKFNEFEMTEDTSWDYSEVPENKWTWDFVEDHWMDCIVNSDGLTYYGTDWTCQSGGGYFGGFQTFEEFLTKRPIQKMPRKIAKEIREYIEEHRKQGGSTLQLIYSYHIEGFKLTQVSFELDERPIHIKGIEEEGDLMLYDGSILRGNHTFGFHFVFQSADEMRIAKGEIKIKIKDGSNQAILKTTENQKGKLTTRLRHG